MDIIDVAIKYRHNRYNRYRYKTDIIDIDKIYIIDIGRKYRQNR